jgi:antitoxin CptB
MTSATETAEARLKRLRLRSIRRGIKEMDLILGGFSEHALVTLSDADLELYDLLLSENDHDLYQWVSGQQPTPPRYLELITRIAADQAARHAPSGPA